MTKHKFFQFFIILVFPFGLVCCKNDRPAGTEAPKPMAKTGNAQIDSLTERIFKEPKNANLYFERAKLFDAHPDKGGYDFAIMDMKYAMKIDSTNVDYHHFLSDIYMKYAQSRLALNTMERAVELYPDRLPTLLKLAEDQVIVQQNAESLQTLNHVLKLDPQNAEAYFLLGQNFKQTKDTTRAINSFQKAVDLNSDYTDAFIELGILFEKKNSPLALKYFDNALLRDSLNLPALFAKGVYFQNKNRIGEAMEIYQKITRIDPHYADAYFNLGMMYLGVDSLNRAYDYFDSVINVKPTYYKAYFYKGQIEERGGDPKAALASYRQATGLAPGYLMAKEAEERIMNNK